MAEEYKPLFNRTYLNLLVVGSALAIFLLTYSSRNESVFFEVDHYPDSALYTLEYDSERRQLDLLLPTHTALSSNDQLLQQLMLQILQARSQGLSLAPGQGVEFSRYQDRLELHLSWPEEQNIPDIAAILEHLGQPVVWQDWKSTFARLKAKQYLNSQDTESRLQERFFDLLSDNPDADPLRRLSHHFSQMFEQPRFVLSGPDLEAGIEQLTQSLHYPPRTELAPATQPALQSQLRESAADKRYHLALGMQIPPRQSPEFARYRISAQLLQDLLSQQGAGMGLEFRMRWAALADRGYQLLILHSDSDPQGKLSKLQQQLTAERLEQSRDKLIKGWLSKMETPDKQAAALRSIAFYRLPAESLQQYVGQLQAVAADDLLKLARQGLQAERQISILVPPTLNR